MVIAVDSFSDDSTEVTVLNEKDCEDLRILEQVVSQISPKSGPLSGNMTIEVKDIETNMSQAPVKALEDPPLNLCHPALLKVPMQVRFGLAGTISNVIFMIGYNTAVPRFDHLMAASTIYAIVYLLFIPIIHALNSLVVFGWPTEYLKSLISNFPIGLSAIVIGATFTAYLDRIRFEVWADDFVRLHITQNPHVETDDVEDLGEFYSSLVVMTITGVWSYVISVMVNSPSSSEPHRKEL
mmetsp:Transcript_5821/g.9670  ORF Transcript_5821/g.9670 Transcript_5821/m.9670 type:complete len:239 (-) Transcript_5821:151-867(-)|eukprot:CAMPEP_0119014950 /NCGR_PEP_ID=MMETSP1176-20130426/10475_1 /TAXON_ID=265551 /ORGANISM="Synedropsis recta cf, Strain CCMP1620" /LENGTH=238 /DNA_ID=CAMNT_0006968201 /DNA_START=40 /DNA_END=756 /DNA_ORIENTATION=+